jgi:nitroreductase
MWKEKRSMQHSTAKTVTRIFASRQVEDDKARSIIEIIRGAALAGTIQNVDVIAVTDRQQCAQLAAAAGGQEFVACAPLVLVFCVSGTPDLFLQADAAIACTYARMASTALGLQAVQVSAFSPNDAAEAIGLQLGRTVLALLPVGYAMDRLPVPLPAPRRPELQNL